jgi:hypothetical protein
MSSLKANFESLRKKFKLQGLVPLIEIEQHEHRPESAAELPSSLESARSLHPLETPTAKNIKEFDTDY